MPKTALPHSTPAHLKNLSCLLALDPRLKAVHEIAGDFPPRTFPPGFAGLARIVIGQQVSVASATAIWTRLIALTNATTAEGFLALGETGLAGVGLSRPKLATLNGVASSIASGELDLHAIARLPADAAIAELTALKGIGPWSAEIYLMFCADHPDIFPAGDLALQKAVAHALRLDPLPTRDALVKLTAAWTPYRSTAALLFWKFYAAINQREAVPV